MLRMKICGLGENGKMANDIKLSLFRRNFEPNQKILAPKSTFGMIKKPNHDTVPLRPFEEGY